MEETASGYQLRVLTASRLRTLLRKRRTRLVPEALAGRIRYMVPELHGPEVDEIEEILRDAVQTARAELHAAGIVPAQTFSVSHNTITAAPDQLLNPRERDHIIDFTALLVWFSQATAQVAHSPGQIQKEQESKEKAAVELAREAVAWGAAAKDRRQLGVALFALALHLEYLDNNQTEAQELFHLGLELLSDMEDRQDIHIRLHLLYALAASLEIQGEFNQAVEVVAQGMRLIETETTPFERAKRVEFLCIQSVIERKRKNYREALEYGQQALMWSTPDYDPIAHCKLLQHLGLLYSTIEHREEALKILLDAITILETYGLASTGAWVYLTTAQHYQALGDSERAHEILGRVERVLGYPAQHFPDRPERILIHIHGTRALLLNSQEEYKEAQTLLEWVIAKFHEGGLLSGEMSSCALAATACGHLGEIEKACHYLERAITCSGGASHLNGLRLRLNLASWKVEANRDAEAETLLDEIEEQLRAHEEYYVKLIRLRARLCEKKGNLRETIRLEREASAIERRMFKSSRERSMRYSRILAETTLLEKMVEQEKEEKQRLEHKLAGAVIELGEKGQLIDRAVALLKEELAGIHYRKGKSTTDQTNLSHIYSILSVLQKGERETTPLFSYLGSAGEEFVKKLRNVHPNLTTSQVRLCVLLQAGLNAGEICTLLNIGSEALKARRKRLRKTFALKKGESLEGHLTTVGQEPFTDSE